jgi:hypothetical protein
MTHDFAPLVLGEPSAAQVFLGPPTVGHLPVSLQGRYVQAGDMIPHEPSLAEFFRALDRDWRGWDGARSWTSVGDGCTIEARHDGVGHASLVFSLSEPGSDQEPVERWAASLEVRIDLSELPTISRRLADFDQLGDLDA